MGPALTMKVRAAQGHLRCIGARSRPDRFNASETVWWDFEMTLDELAFLLTLALAAVAWYRTYREFNSTTLIKAVAATWPLLRD